MSSSGGISSMVTRPHHLPHEAQSFTCVPGSSCTQTHGWPRTGGRSRQRARRPRCRLCGVCSRSCAGRGCAGGMESPHLLARAPGLSWCVPNACPCSRPHCGLALLATIIPLATASLILHVRCPVWCLAWLWVQSGAPCPAMRAPHQALLSCLSCP